MKDLWLTSYLESPYLSQTGNSEYLEDPPTPSWRLHSPQRRIIIVPLSEGFIYARNRTKFTLTGWILKAAFVVIFSISQERSLNIQVVLWLAQGQVSGIQTHPWLHLYCSTSCDHPRRCLLPWASVLRDCQVWWLGAPQSIRPPVSESWSLCICWASYFTPLNLNFLFYQMGIILVIILQRAMRSIHLTWHSTEHIVLKNN